MKSDLNRVGAALARLDAAATAEGIEPGSYLGVWHAAQMEVTEALLSLETAREGKLQEMLDAAAQVAQVARDTAALEVERANQERRKIERFLEQAKVSLGEKESATVQSLVEALSYRMQDAMVIRARAWSKAQYWRVACLQVAAGVAVILVGVWLGSWLNNNGAPGDFLNQCAQTLKRDPETGTAFCAVRLSRVLPR